jgi:hypothetical protein
LRAGVVAGAIAGAVVGGIGGRIAMRIVALVDESADGVRTDFGATAGEITIGGTFTLIVMMTIAGILGGLLYVAVRRWLPWPGLGRAIVFGLLIALGPGRIAVGEVDFQIFEPPLLFFAIFIVVEAGYGVAVALLADRLHPAPPITPGPRIDPAANAALALAAVALTLLTLAIMVGVIQDAGICLSAAEAGGCAAPADP